MKCVGTPISLRRLKIYSEMRLFTNALPLETLMLLGVERSRVVLEVLNERAGFRPFIKDLRLSFIDAATAVIHWETPFL